MSSTFGENLKFSIFGQSHGPAIGMTLDGIPAGLPVDFQKLQQFLNRRSPGQNGYSSPRLEADEPEFLSGIINGFTCGAPVAAILHNRNANSADYADRKQFPRPGHADYTAQIKYAGYQDSSGGGHFSGRLTAPLCIAGGLCLQWLSAMGIEIRAHISQIGPVLDDRYDPMAPQYGFCDPMFPTISSQSATEMQAVITFAKEAGDSVGGEIECAITGLPAGIGAPMFGGVENRLAQIIYGIPAVKSLEFGAGSACKAMYGSQFNDAFTSKNSTASLMTNRCGGILGGISTGTPVLFRVAMKPTPSIAIPQQTVNMLTGEAAMISVSGRHDPCIVPRAVPAVEAAAAIAIYDMILGNTQTPLCHKEYKL